jgi:hypothetical protein
LLAFAVENYVSKGKTMSIKTDDIGEFMNDWADREGVSVATTSDGTVLLFRRDYLLSILEENADQEKLIIFVKHPTQH